MMEKRREGEEGMRRRQEGEETETSTTGKERGELIAVGPKHV